MVGLSIVDQESFSGANKPTNELGRYLRLRRRLSTVVSQNQILDLQCRCNVLTGVAGIGKTSTIENIALSWARDPSYFSTNAFQYVFLFSCRKLNEYRKRSITFEQLFEAEFNIKLSTLSNTDGKEVLIIIDGIDEIESLSSMLQMQEVDEIYQLLHEIIKDQSCIFPGHTTLLAGRPHIIPTLKRFQHHTGPIRIVHIQGFDDQSILAYVKKFCHNNEAMVNRIMEKLGGSVTVKAMAAVPQLLSSICSIYSWEFSDFHLEKKTELFVWVFLSLLKHQFPQFNGMLPRQLMEDAAVKSFFSAISKISYDLILDNRILFEENEVKELGTSDPLLKKLLDAFVLRIDTKSATCCQFAHLIVQEFFAAVHCYVSGKSIGSLLDREFYEIAEFYVGFASADQNIAAKDDDVVALFIRNIPPRFRRSFRKSFTKPKKPSVSSLLCEIFSSWEGWKLSCDIFCSLFYELINIGDSIPECITFANHTDVILSGLTPFQVVRLNHFLRRLLSEDSNGHGPHAFKNVTVTIKRTEFSNSSEFCSFLQLLRSFKEVSFINCMFGTHALETLCTVSSPSKPESWLVQVSFKACDLSHDNISAIARCMPLLQKFSFESIKLDLTATNILVREIMGKGHSSAFKLRELGLRDCYLDDFCIEALCKCLHLIETIDLSKNHINRVRMDLLIRYVRERYDQPKFNLKQLILRECTSSNTDTRRPRGREQNNISDIAVDIVFD